jgi:uncharacterized protein YndB with AHSA1/START domain
MNDGVYIIVKDRPAVRLEREYAHPIHRVWQAVVDPGQARQWFPSTLVFEPEVGGSVRFTDDPHIADGDGVVLEYDPPHVLSFSWGDGEVHIALTPVGEERCRFILTNVLGAGNEAARNAAGWQVCLGELDKVIRGQETNGPHAETAIDWRTSYDAYVQSGMPAGATIPN